MRAVVVPDGVAGRRGHPAPPQDVLHRDVGERCRCPLQHRSRGGVSVGGQQGEPVEQQVEGTRSTRPRRERPDGAADLQQDAPSRELPSGDGRRAPGGQVGLARELEVERLEPPRGLQQQRRSIAGKTRGEGELAAHQVHPGALELIQRPGLRRGHEPERRLERAGLETRLRRGQRALGSSRRVDRELGGALQERGRRGDAAAGLRTAGRAFELGGDLLVGPRGGAGAVPGPPVRVGLGDGGIGQGTMHAVPVVRGCRAIGGGPDERVRELDAPAQLEQPAVLCRARRRDVDPERPRGTVEQDRVAEGLCGSREDEQLGVGREQLEAPDVALLDPAGDRLTAGKTEPAGETGDVPRARQLEQGERVAVTLLDDLVANGGVQGAGHVGQQQRAGIAVAECVDRQDRQPGENVIAGPRPRGAHDRDPLGEQAAGNEPQDLRRGVVEPLRVVDDTGQRLLLGDLGEQRQRGQPDQEPVGRGASAAAEHRRERVALRGGQPVRGGPAWARRAGAGRRRPAPSPTRRRRLSRRASRRPGRTGSPAARSCPRPPRPAGR